MKLNPILNKIVRAADKNQLISFTYEKDSGEITHRTLRPGINIAAKFEREGNPLNGKGNWATGIKRKGKNNCIVLRGKDTVVSGTDFKDGKFKYFKLSGIRDLK